jgi:hypothetical protein
MQGNTTHFNLRRLGLLLQRDLQGGYRGVLITMAAVAGFVVLVSALSLLGGTASEGFRAFHMSMYRNLLFVGGFIITSLAFRELYHNERGYQYVTLPGSTLEKFASKLLLTSLGYALVTLAAYTAAAALSEAINRAVFGFGHALFNPFRRDVLTVALAYLVLQSVFLAGSVYFRKLAFVKTSLFTIGVIVALAVVLGVVTGAMLRGYRVPGTHDIRLTDELFRRAGMEEWIQAAGRQAWLVARVLFWGALAPACWLIGYLRLREVEL